MLNQRKIRPGQVWQYGPLENVRYGFHKTEYKAVILLMKVDYTENAKSDSVYIEAINCDGKLIKRTLPRTVFLRNFELVMDNECSTRS